MFSVLADDENMVIGLDDLIEIDDVRVADFFHDLDLTLDSQLIIGLLDAVLIDYLYCYFFTCGNVCALLYLAEGTFA